MNFYLTATFQMRVSLNEIREHEAALKPRGELPQGVISEFPPAYHHTAFDCKAVAAKIEGQWVPVDEAEIDELLAKEGDCAIAWVDHVESLTVGISSSETTLDFGWLSEEIDNQPWDELLVDALKMLEKEIEAPVPAPMLGRLMESPPQGWAISLIYPLHWESSVDWESGIDEGGFRLDPPASRIVIPAEDELTPKTRQALVELGAVIPTTPEEVALVENKHTDAPVNQADVDASFNRVLRMMAEEDDHRKRGEWLVTNKAPKDWVILTKAEVAELRHVMGLLETDRAKVNAIAKRLFAKTTSPELTGELAEIGRLSVIRP